MSWLLDCFRMESLGSTVHRQECLKERDGGGFKIWNFLLVVGCWVCLFVLDYSNAFCKALVIIHTKRPLSEFCLVAVRQKLQMLPCWSICTVQLRLRGG